MNPLKKWMRAIIHAPISSAIALSIVLFFAASSASAVWLASAEMNDISLSLAKIDSVELTRGKVLGINTHSNGLINFNSKGEQVVRFDTDGNAIDAHDGEIKKFGDTFYLYGTSYSCGFAYLSANSKPFCGFKVYSSPDLVTWTNRGLLFDPKDWQTVCANIGCFRPHVLFNGSKYVLWFNAASPIAYRVFTSTSPTGPFVETANPTGVGALSWAGDFNLFQDTDNSAYLVYTNYSNASQMYLRVEKLNTDYTNSTGNTVNINLAGGEAPAMFKRDGKYYIVYNQGCAYCTNGTTKYLMANSPLGPWQDMGQISADSCGGQPAHVQQINDRYLYMSDLWQKFSGQDISANQGSANYFWNWLNFNTDGTLKPLTCDTSFSGLGFTTNQDSSSVSFSNTCDIKFGNSRLQTFKQSVAGQLNQIILTLFQSGAAISSGFQYLGEPVKNDLKIELVKISNGIPAQILQTIFIPANKISYAPTKINIPVSLAVQPFEEYGIVLSSETKNACYGTVYSSENPYTEGQVSVGTGNSFSLEQGKDLRLEFSFTASQEVTSRKPLGYMDGVRNNEIIFGWAKDEDDASRPIKIHLYFDKNAGTAGASPVEVLAADFRSDIGSHAFNIPVPDKYKDGQYHQVWAWAIDLTDNAYNAMLIGSPKIFLLNPTNYIQPTPAPTVIPTPTPTPTTLACVQRNFNSSASGVYLGTSKVSSLTSGQSFAVKCDYGIVSGYITLDGNGATNCSWGGFSGTVAQFNCVAPQQSGSYSVSCSMTSQSVDNSCGAINSVGIFTVQAQTTVTPRVGQLVNINGTVSLVGQNGRYGFPDLATFNSWSLNFSNVVAANSAEINLPQVGIVPMRLPCYTDILTQINSGVTSCPTTSTSASLITTLDASTSLSKNIYYKSTNVDVMSVKITASGDNISLYSLEVISDAAICPVGYFSLYDGATLLRSQASNSSNCALSFDSLNLIIPQNLSKILTLKVTSGDSGNTAAVKFGMRAARAAVQSNGVLFSLTGSYVYGNVMTFSQTTVTPTPVPTVTPTPTPTPTTLACTQRSFNTTNSGIYSGVNKITSLTPNQNFYVKCDYGLVSAYITLDGNGAANCNWNGWSGTSALFNCSAPAQTGSYSVSCRMANNTSDNSCSALNSVGSYSVGLTPTPTPTPATQALSIVTSTLPNATAGQSYSTNIQISGGIAPYNWTFLSTTYPSGCCILGLNGNLGPTYATTMNFNTQSSQTVSTSYIGTYGWTFKVTDATGNSVTKNIYLTINPAVFTPTPTPTPTITPTPTPTPTIAACINRNFNQNTSGYFNSQNTKITQVEPNQTYKIKCDYGLVSGYITLDGVPSGSCYYNGQDYTSSAAVFVCTAPGQTTNISASCRITNNPAADNSCSALNSIGSLAVQAQAAITPRVGQLINKNSTVYLVGQNGLYGFPDLATFNSWGLNFASVLPANSAEIALSQIGIVPTKLSCYSDIITQINSGVASCPDPVITREVMAKKLVQKFPQNVSVGASPSFNDVPQSNQYYNFIEQIYSRGITNGCYYDAASGIRNYCPTEPVKRWQAMLFLARTLGNRVDLNNIPTNQIFSDVPASNAAYAQTQYFYQKGVVLGCRVNTDGTRDFCPDDNLTESAFNLLVDRIYANIGW